MKLNLVTFILIFIAFCQVPGAGAQSLNCGDTINTSTTLSNDLLNCPGNGLIIGASNITLDCNGHSISGSLGGSGIYVNGKDSITIKNCIIENFSQNIYLEKVTNSNFLENNISHSGFGIYLGGQYNYGNKIYKNQLIENSDGISMLVSVYNDIYENQFNNSVYDLRIKISASCNSNKIYRNAFMGGGTSDTSPSNTYCFEGIGNLYLGGSGKNRAENDCGPTPLQRIIHVNSSAKTSVIWNASAVYNNIQDAVANSNENTTVVVVEGTNFEGLTFSRNHGVVLDCRGASITGTGTGTGIALVKTIDTKIMNCEISGFSDGILGSGICTGTELGGLSVHNNVNGMRLIDRDSWGVAEGISFHNNSNAGLKLYYSEFWVFRNNTIINNAIGVYMTTYSNTNHLIENNKIEDNSFGFYMETGSALNNITGNVINSSLIGMRIRYGLDNRIYGNTFYGKGIEENSIPSSFCEGIGNLYLEGSGKNRAENDCGPTPLQRIIHVNSSAKTSVIWNASAVYNNIQDAVANSNENTTVVVVEGTNFEGATAWRIRNLTIDCQGASITGTGTGTGLYLVNTSYSNIKNCKISGFSEGISSAQRCYGSVFNGLEVFNNTNGVKLADLDSDGIMKDSIIRNNAQSGIVLSKTENWTFSNNTISNNSLGIYSLSSSQTDVYGCNLEHNNNYNFYNGNIGDVGATMNWWGTKNRTLIEKSIYDFFDNRDNGIVYFDPWLSSRSNELQIIGNNNIILNGRRYYIINFYTIGGFGGYSWSISKGRLPSGMMISESGNVEGMPKYSGNFSFTLSVNDSTNKEAHIDVNVSINPSTSRLNSYIGKVGTAAVPGRIMKYFIVFQNKDKNIMDLVVHSNKNLLEDLEEYPENYIVEFIDTSMFEIVSTSPKAEVLPDNPLEPLNYIVWNLTGKERDSFILEEKPGWMEGMKVFTYEAKLNSCVTKGTNVLDPVCWLVVIPCADQSQAPIGEFPYKPLGGTLSVCNGNGIPDGGYLCRFGRHTGVDLVASVGTNVYSIDGGIVQSAGFENESNHNQGNGKRVIIRHSNGCLSVYAHLDSFSVNNNQRVLAGDPIGKTGMTGNAYNTPCPHLHFYYQCPGSGAPKDRVDPCKGLGEPDNCRCDCHDFVCDDFPQIATDPHDPNEKLSISKKFLKTVTPLTYYIMFENTGNASAKDVYITDNLSKNINTSTLTTFSENHTAIELKDGGFKVTLFRENRTQTLNMTLGNQTIEINMSYIEEWTVSLKNNVLFWNLSNIYLEPNDTGNVIFSVRVRNDLKNGTEIRNNATIQFEIFESMTTNSTLNIIDEVPPECKINPLPGITNSTNFTISWNGSDPLGEIESYMIFFSKSVKGANPIFEPLIDRTSETSYEFSGDLGKTYKFACIATDTAGNSEIQEPVAEAETVVSSNSDIDIIGQPRIGSRIQIVIKDENVINETFYLALGVTGDSPGLPVGDGRFLSVNYDAVGELTFFAPFALGIKGTPGKISENGTGIITWDIPNLPLLAGIKFYVSCFTHDPTKILPESVLSICEKRSFTITK